MQKKFNENLHGYVTQYEETSRQQESQQNQPKAIENKELLQQIENAQNFRNPNDISPRAQIQPQHSSNIFDLPLEQPEFAHLASIDVQERDDPFMSPNKSYTMPQIDQIMQTE